jgi:hypothetical protein
VGYLLKGFECCNDKKAQRRFKEFKRKVESAYAVCCIHHPEDEWVRILVSRNISSKEEAKFIFGT